MKSILPLLLTAIETINSRIIAIRRELHAHPISNVRKPYIVLRAYNGCTSYWNESVIA